MNTVASIMTPKVLTADPAASLAETIATIAEKRVSSVVAVEGPRPAGILSERDVLQRVVAAGRDPATLRVADVMSAPVCSVAQETTVLQALDILRGHHFRRLPVVDAQGALIGIVTQTDLVRALLASFRRHTLRDLLETMMQFETRHAQQTTALETLTRRYHALDLHGAEVLALLQRTLRNLAGPLTDIRSVAADLAETTRAMEILLSAGQYENPALRSAVQRAEATLRRVAAENGAWVVDMTAHLGRASEVIDHLIRVTAALQAGHGALSGDTCRPARPQAQPREE